MDDLHEQLIDHMDTSERTIQGSFCSLLNWCEKTIQRLGVESRSKVSITAWHWWRKMDVRNAVMVDVRDMLGMTIDAFCCLVVAVVETESKNEKAKLLPQGRVAETGVTDHSPKYSTLNTPVGESGVSENQNGGEKT